MGMCGASPPDPNKAAAAGLQAQAQLQPFDYLINSASTLGQPITINGKTYDFTGQGQADVAGQVSDQMAQALLDLQKTQGPVAIQQRLDELKAADPQGYAARQDLFNRIMSDAQANPNRPVSSDLQQQLQDELAKGVGFNDARQEQEVRDQVRGQQVSHGIYLGNSPTTQEGETVVQAGEQLQNQRQQDALALLQSGASPEDIAYRNMQQNISNLANFSAGQTPTAQFAQVSAANRGPIQNVGGAPSTNGFDMAGASAAGQQANAAYSGALAAQANPWLSGLSTGVSAFGAAYPYLNNGYVSANTWNPGSVYTPQGNNNVGAGYINNGQE